MGKNGRLPKNNTGVGTGTGVARLSEMRDAAYNPRRIKDTALAALRKSLLCFGDISGAVYNRRTGNIVCGHQRRKVLTDLHVSDIAWGEEYTVELGDGDTHPKFQSRERAGYVTLPGGARMSVRQVDWPPIFEKAANVAANNPHLGGTFTDGISKLLDEIKLEMPKLAPAMMLDELMVDSAVFEHVKPAVDEFKDKLGATSEFSRDGINWSSSNEYGLPDLRADMLGKQVCKTVWAGGRALADISETMFLYGINLKERPQEYGKGVQCFYLPDERFEMVWNRPFDVVKRWLDEGVGCALSPDFSLWLEAPMAVQLWAMFRSRWCARFWQEKGIRVIPSLNWSNEASLRWAFWGIPKKPPVVYVQCRTLSSDKDSQVRFAAGMRAAVKTIEPGHVCIYGAENREYLERNLPRSVDYTWIPSWTMVRPAFRERQGKDGWRAAPALAPEPMKEASSGR